MTLTLPARLFNLTAFAQPIRVFLRGPATNCRNSRLSNWGGLELIIFETGHLFSDFNLWRTSEGDRRRTRLRDWRDASAKKMTQGGRYSQ
jgi:hypothetical protein